MTEFFGVFIYIFSFHMNHLFNALLYKESYHIIIIHTTIRAATLRQKPILHTFSRSILIPVVPWFLISHGPVTAFVPGRLGQLFGFLLQQLVQWLLDAAADQFLDLSLDYLLVELYNLFGHGLQFSFRRMLCGNSILPESVNRVFLVI